MNEIKITKFRTFLFHLVQLQKLFSEKNAQTKNRYGSHERAFVATTMANAKIAQRVNSQEVTRMHRGW